MKVIDTELTPCVFRYKIIIEYLGSGFCGWQRQESCISVQQVLEESIERLFKEKVLLIAAGRTDAGVHAYGQVAHFDLTKEIDVYKAVRSINYFVRPHKVAVLACQLVDNSFHARFSATQRQYVYKILCRPSELIIENGLKLWVREPLSVESMQQAANYLIGKHDFSSFRATSCQAKSPIKTLSNIEIIKQGDNINIYVSAPSFLHHMVRNIVGSLLLVGRGIWPAQKIKEVLEQKNRIYAGPTAPAKGLYFLAVKYPK